MSSYSVIPSNEIRYRRNLHDVERALSNSDQVKDERSEMEKDIYHLGTLDGLRNRASDIKSDKDRLNKLGLGAIRCTNENCRCTFDRSNYAGLPEGYIDELERIESHPLTYYRSYGVDIDSRKIILCRLCHECLKCKGMRCNCKNDLYQYYTSNRSRRKFIRFMWRVITLFGLLISMYFFFMDRILASIALIAGALFIALNDDIRAMFIPFVTKDKHPTIEKADIDVQNMDVDDFASWMINLGIVLGIYIALQLIRLVEKIWYTAYTPIIQQYNRIRFNTIEEENFTFDKHMTFVGWEYFSDAEEEGYNDPDVAAMNLTAPPDANCIRRWRRRIFLC